MLTTIKLMTLNRIAKGLTYNQEIARELADDGYVNFKNGHRSTLTPKGKEAVSNE